jgi:dTDP-3-amino-3,4,6-trideoxy-alpha-D-glucose transaminase
LSAARAETVVPFVDLRRAQTDGIVKAALDRVLESGSFILGPESEAFEREFAEAQGSRHAAAIGSGTDAIELALRALGIGPGDEVVTQANTCVPTVAAIAATGATPVVCDVERAAGTMSPTALRQALSSATRAVVPVHLYGQCADVHQLREVLEGREVPVVEDCAHAHGATLGDAGAGTMGVAGCFSFYPTKNLGALGDAGAVITDRSDLADRIRRMRTYGDEAARVAPFGASRMDELQAAVLRAKLSGLAHANARRAQIAESYDEGLADVALRPLERLPDRQHVYHLYVVEVPNRDTFRAEMTRRGVTTLVHYPVLPHTQPPYDKLARCPVPVPNAEALTRHVVSLPIYPELSHDQVRYVIDAAREASRVAAT